MFPPLYSGWQNFVSNQTKKNMNTKNKISTNPGLIIGILGFVAGIGLLFTESWFIGIFGSIASAGIAYKGYQDAKEPNK